MNGWEVSLCGIEEEKASCDDNEHMICSVVAMYARKTDESTPTVSNIRSAPLCTTKPNNLYKKQNTGECAMHLMG